MAGNCTGTLLQTLRYRGLEVVRWRVFVRIAKIDLSENRSSLPPIILPAMPHVKCFSIAAVILCFGTSSSQAQTYESPESAAKDPDFLIQGEYVRASDGTGLQVVTRGKGEFELVLFTGGLPGAGWNRAETRRIEADRDEAEDFLEGFEKVTRKSPTLGKQRPDNATMLFDRTAASFDAQAYSPPLRFQDDGLLLPGATSIDRFRDYTLHVEFRTPFQPATELKQRGRSGVLHQGRYETPIADSFGSPGKDHEIGGIPGVREPSLNMCFPPLSWQTLDFDFVAARFDGDAKISPARLTIRLNGVVVNREVELHELSDSVDSGDDDLPGHIILQDHGSPVHFRNIWIQPTDFSALARRPIVPAFERFYTGADSDTGAGGRLLLGELNCLSCHDAEPHLASSLNPRRAPILTEVARRLHPEWMVKFIANPHEVKGGTTMPDVMRGMSVAQRQEAAISLVNYLVGDRSVDLGGSNDNQNGQQLFQEVGCVACHQSQDESIQLSSATSVPLPNLAEKYSFVGLDRFLQNPAAVRPSSRMPHIGLDDKERRSIANYLAGGSSFSWSDQGKTPAKPNIAFRVYHGQWDSMPDFEKLKPAKSGEVAGFSIRVAEKTDLFGIVYEAYLPVTTTGAYTFRTVSDDGSKLYVNGNRIVNNDGVHGVQSEQGSVKLEPGIYPVRVEFFEKNGGEELSVFWTGPGVRGRRLDSDLVLSPENLPDAIRKLTSGEATPAAPSNDHQNEYQYSFAPDRMEEGRKLFTSLGCANCHQHEVGGARVASTLTAPRLTSCRETQGCLAEKRTAKEANVPDFELSSIQRAALAAAVAEAPESVVNTQQQLTHIFNSFNCYACHERDGIGGPEGDRNQMFLSTIPEMGDEGRLPPPLSGVGDKLSESYLNHILSNGANERPYMKTRMPKFGLAGTKPLVQIFRDLDLKTEAEIAELDESPKRVAAVGRALAGDKGLSCVKCHTFDRFKATGIQAIAMDRMASRLREDWFHRYLVNPVKYRPGTRMPTAFPNGKSVATEVYDGDPQRQLSAMWAWMTLGNEGGVPSGVAGGMIELKPENHPIIYRNFLEGLSSRGIAVGYPERAHLAWDADRFALTLLWQGSFIDASMHWQGRGQGRQRPLGDNVITWEKTVPVAVLASPDAPWPESEPKDRGYRFSGYRLDEQLRPAFRYRTAAFTVVDRPIPVKDGDYSTFRREITVADQGDSNLIAQPNGQLYFRAAIGQSLEQIDSGWWETEESVRISVGGGKPILREVGDHVELLVPLNFGETIVQQIVW